MNTEITDVNRTIVSPEQLEDPQGFLRRAFRSKLAVTGIVTGGAVLAALAAAAVMLMSSSPPVPAQISVREVINKVETDRPRGLGPVVERFLPVVIGQELVPGDGLKTFANSEARVDISIADYTRVSRTKPNTVWRLGQFSLEEETIIELDQGRIFLFDDVADPTGRPFKVVTPAGTASPRGTWMSFAYDPVEEVAELQCFRGTCVLENDLGIQVLKDEEKSVITQISAPVEPIVMTVEETTTFEELPEAATGEVRIPEPEPTPEPTQEPTPEPMAQPTENPSTGSSLDPVFAPDPVPAPNIGDSDSGNNSSGDSDGTEVSNPDPDPDPDPNPNPAATPMPASTAIPKPTPRLMGWRLFNRVPTPTILPTSMPRFRLEPDFPDEFPDKFSDDFSGKFSDRFSEKFSEKFNAELPEIPESLIITLPPVESSVLPHIIVGTVSIDSVPAIDGAEVTLWTDGYTEPVATSSVSDGTYTVLVPQYGVDSFEGRRLLFKVNNLVAQVTASWMEGGSDLIDLTVTTETPDPQPTLEIQETPEIEKTIGIEEP